MPYVKMARLQLKYGSIPNCFASAASAPNKYPMIMPIMARDWP